MKKLFFLVIIGLAAAGFVSAQVAQGGTLYVAIKTLALKSSTGIFASTTGTLEYGDRVTVIRVSGNNVEIRSAANASLTGWTSSSNLTAKQIVSGNTATVSARETALAGKGFNQEVEDSYKTQGNLNYAEVDRVERITVREAELRPFMENGRLSMGGN